MQKQSNQNLPAFFVSNKPFPFTKSKNLVGIPLEIYDFTFLHFHDCLEIGYCLDGKGICRVEDQTHTFKKGDVEIIFPYQKHLSRSYESEQSLWYWLFINPYSLMDNSGFSNASKIEHMISKEMGLCGIFSEENYPEITELVYKIFQEIGGENAEMPYYTELCASYVYQLLIHLTQLSANLPKLQIQQDRNMISVLPAIDLISENVHKGVVPSVEMLASECGMSLSNFRKVFHKIIGLTPKDYITKSVLYRAQKLLLSTDKSILEISVETGFKDLSGFNRQFLAKTGMTPSSFRKTYKRTV